METISLGVILGIIAITYLQPPKEKTEINMRLRVGKGDEYDVLLKHLQTLDSPEEITATLEKKVDDPCIRKALLMRIRGEIKGMDGKTEQTLKLISEVERKIQGKE